MITRLMGVYLALIVAAEAEQWEPSLATTASLRTGGARLTSSDALTLDKGNIGLITYWEVRSDNDLDIYRCVDVVDSRFAPVRQDCWRVLRPTGSRSARAREASSSRDLCANPDDFGGVSDAGYCSYSRPTAVRTPVFELTVEPFGERAAVAVSDEGRSLFVIDPPWPSAVAFGVSVMDKADRVAFASASSTMDILDLQDETVRCEPREVSSRTWIACESEGAPSATTTMYRIDDGLLYEVWYSYPEDVAQHVRGAVDRMIGSFRSVVEAAP